MLLELFSFVNFINAMAFVYACLDGPVKLFFSDFLHYFDTSIVISYCYPGGYLISIAYCLIFIVYYL